MLSNNTQEGGNALRDFHTNLLFPLLYTGYKADIVFLWVYNRNMINQQDKELLQQKGITEEIILKQIEKIRKGSSSLNIIEAAVSQRGIILLDEAQRSSLINLWQEEKEQWQSEKFVPASGAASRMFKSLFQYMKNQEEDSEVERFFENLDQFPFYRNIYSFIKDQGLSDFSDPSVRTEILSYLLKTKGLNWGNQPKGLLPFHDSPRGTRTPVGEHLCEGRYYVREKDNKVPIHFTVSSDAEEAFQQRVEKEKTNFENVDYSVSYSFQDPSTDTVALDDKGELFRLSSGELLFRPGGHGSLIKNLNQRPSDVLFIKNIDNVQKESMQTPTIENFQALAGLLLQTRKELIQLEQSLKTESIDNPSKFLLSLKELTGHDYSEVCKNPLERKDELLHLLNSPIRICGMVKNEGEPGGGPFRVKNKEGISSLQIVETAQIDLNKEEDRKIMEQSTHFNPVFLVCMKKDLHGNALDLSEYVDQDAYFTADKSLEGRSLTALEHPGLWNGAMAKWVTRFVEIPAECFTPVKTVNDLLRDAHR